MSKFNRKFNSAVSRLAFWHSLSAQLAGFNNILKSATNLTPEDAATLKDIHHKLLECSCVVKGRLQVHGLRINNLRKELHNHAQN